MCIRPYNREVLVLLLYKSNLQDCWEGQMKLKAVHCSCACLPHVSRHSICVKVNVTVQFHAVVLAAFASIIAPFGGFFASGFKRGFKIKDFGDSIPGHGGMTDRMDCQVSPQILYNITWNTRHPNKLLELCPTAFCAQAALCAFWPGVPNGCSAPSASVMCHV